MMMKKKIKMISISFDNEFAACHMLIFNNGNIPLHMPRSRITHTHRVECWSRICYFFSFASITCVLIVRRVRCNCNHFKIEMAEKRNSTRAAKNQMDWNWKWNENVECDSLLPTESFANWLFNLDFLFTFSFMKQKMERKIWFNIDDVDG